MKNIRKRPIILFLIVLIGLYIVIYIVPRVTDRLQPTYVAEYGTLETSDDATGYFVRNEKVYASGNSGTQNRYIANGKLVQKDTKVLEVNEEDGTTAGDEEATKGASRYQRALNRLGDAVVGTESYKTKEEGVVFYSLDGYEAELTPSKMKDLTERQLKHYDNDALQTIESGEVRKFDPVFRLVDRSAWYILCFVPEDHADRYEPDATVSVRINGKTTIIGTVYGKKEMSGKIRLIIRTNYYYRKFATVRQQDVKVITSSRRGLLLRNSSITKKKGVTGVYVRQTDGSYAFTPVDVLSTDGEWSAVSRSTFHDKKGNVVKTIKTYDEILRKAK